MKRSVVWCLVLAMGLMCFGGIQAEAKDSMKVIYSKNDFMLDVMVAQEKGFFEMLDLDFEPIHMTGPMTLSGLQRDEVSGCFTSSPAALAANQSGMRLIMVSGLGLRSFDYYVLADSPIQSIHDFEGKRIGNSAPPGGPAFGLTYDMEKLGIKAEIIIIRNASQRASALLSGNVDAVYGTPYFKAQFGSQVRKVHTSTITKYLWNSCGWWFKPDYIEKHPLAIKKFVDGQLMGRFFIRNNPKEALDIMARQLNLDLTQFKEPVPIPYFDMPITVYQYGLQKTAEILVKYGHLKAVPDVTRLVDPRFSVVIDQDY